MAKNTDLIKDALIEFDLMIAQLSRGKPVKNIDAIAMKFLVADVMDDDILFLHEKDILQYLIHMNNYQI